MRHFSTTASALRLSALIVAAGTVLGLAGQVVAQSAPIQAEKAHREATEAREQARRIVVEMRKELANAQEEADDEDGEGDEKEVRVFVQRGQGGGVWTTEAPHGAQGGGTWTTQAPRGGQSGGTWTTQAPRKSVQVEVQPDGQKRRTQVFRHAEGDEGQQRFEVQVEPGEGKRRVERIQVKRLGGEGVGAGKCPACGCECCGGDGEDRVIELHGLGGPQGHLEGHFGELKELGDLKGLGELKELHGMKIQGLEGLEGLKKMHIEGLEGMKLEGLEGKKMFLGDGRALRGFGMGGEQPKVFGKAIVIGPDGKQQEFNFGGDDAAPRAKAPKAPKPPKPAKAPKPAKTPKAAEGMFFEAPGPGMHEGHGEGKVIIITPDGQRREFNFGGEEDGPRSEVTDPFDGNDHAAHPFGGGTIVVPLGAESVQGQVKFVRVNRGGAV